MSAFAEVVYDINKGLLWSITGGEMIKKGVIYDRNREMAWEIIGMSNFIYDIK